MFEEFYEMYEPEEQEVVALINRCIGGGYNWKGSFWEMTVVTLGMVFCDTGKVSTKEERLEWPVTEEERNSEKGWGRFEKEQICRLKIRRMKEERAKDLVVRPWCISEIVNAHEDCPELQAVLDEYHKPVVIQDQVLGELTLDKDYDTFEGEIQWQEKNVLLSLEVNAESKPSWTRARSAAKKMLADCENWDKAMRELAAKDLTELANNWLSQDEENPRDPGTDPSKLSFAEMVDFLKLKRFGSLVDDEMDQQVFIMDLSFNPEITDELMVIYFDLNKEIFCITHES